MELEEKQFYVFVYGSLKKGFGNSSYIGMDSTFICSTQTAEKKFNMVSLGAFPACSEGGTSAIKGELYLVDEPTMMNVDFLEGNGMYYTRKLVKLASGHTAWIYLVEDGVFGPSVQTRQLTRDYMECTFEWIR